MASGLSSPQDTALMNHQLAITTYTPTAVIAISLHTVALGNAKVLASEWPTVNWNYARIAAGTNGTGIGTASWTVAAFVASTGVVSTNATQVAFVAASGTASPQALAAVGFNGGVTPLNVGGGTLLFFADLGTSQNIASTIIVAFFVGDISFTLN